MRALSKLRWLVAAILPVLLAAEAAGAARGWPMRRQGKDLLIETPHYSIQTDLGPEIGQTIARHQEALYAELYRRMGKIKSRGKMTDRLNVLVFETYERYRRELGSDVENTAGIFIPYKDVLACWGPADRLDRILQLLRHEGTHQFVRHFIGKECPVWLNEGLAQFYEHGQIRGDRLEVGAVIPGKLARLKRAIEQGETILLDRMLRMSNTEWVGAVHSGATHAGLQYDQAWAMVHFLAYGGGKKYQGAFFQFIYYLARGREPWRAWERVFGTDYDGFEKHWREYVRDLEPSSDLECRLHLEMLGRLLYWARDKKELITDIVTFRRAVLDGKLGMWSMTTSDGLRIAGDDTEQLASLFKCPGDERPDAETSYELVSNPDGGTPILRCSHHGGLVFETRYVKDPESGEVDVKVVALPAKPGK